MAGERLTLGGSSCVRSEPASWTSCLHGGSFILHALSALVFARWVLHWRAARCELAQLPTRQRPRRGTAAARADADRAARGRACTRESASALERRRRVRTRRSRCKDGNAELGTAHRASRGRSLDSPLLRQSGRRWPLRSTDWAWLGPRTVPSMAKGPWGVSAHVPRLEAPQVRVAPRTPTFTLSLGAQP